MKRFFQSYGGIMIALAILILATMGYLERIIFPVEAKVEGPPPFLRLHVLANSDSEADQELKLAVRDLVLVELNSTVRNAQDFNNALAAVEANLPKLQDRIKKYLVEKSSKYSGQTKVGVERMPAVNYGFITLPEGEYWSLKVTLGEGKGQNWWCVLYPPLCFLDLNDPEAVTVLADEKPTKKPISEDSSWQRWQQNVEREVRKIWLTQ